MLDLGFIAFSDSEPVPSAPENALSFSHKRVFYLGNSEPKWLAPCDSEAGGL
jgi:hypothetical protein